MHAFSYLIYQTSYVFGSLSLSLSLFLTQLLFVLLLGFMISELVKVFVLKSMANTPTTTTGGPYDPDMDMRHVFLVLLWSWDVGEDSAPKLGASRS